ncbi:hypothetical protein ZIOFF_045113 [Zingiber officinale]|uniref:Integrase catalytic domain-containing protein n=1 Tax=Zingiber officinale TaxID=94328 RepID=A0A8J5G0E0_ZINOF|nr:hypothetical protein ZIOFF_045113 [Zingiber officinale]
MAVMALATTTSAPPHSKLRRGAVTRGHSRSALIGFIASRAKNDSFQAFKKFKFLMDNKTEHKIRTLRTDRGDEFLSTEFIRFCENEGIE